MTRSSTLSSKGRSPCLWKFAIASGSKKAIAWISLLKAAGRPSAPRAHRKTHFSSTSVSCRPLPADWTQILGFVISATNTAGKNENCNRHQRAFRSLSKEPSAPDIARSLADAKGEGGLVVSAPVYAELLAYPKATESFVNGFLQNTGIDVEFSLQQSVWIEAGRRFSRYAQRRRRATRQNLRRCLPISLSARTPWRRQIAL